MGRVFALFTAEPALRQPAGVSGSSVLMFGGRWKIRLST
jgi:hypothetical protein